MKKVIFILTIVLVILFVCFAKPLNIKPINDLGNQCEKDMQKNEKMICD